MNSCNNNIYSCQWILQYRTLIRHDDLQLQRYTWPYEEALWNLLYQLGSKQISVTEMRRNLNYSFLAIYEIDICVVLFFLIRRSRVFMNYKANNKANNLDFYLSWCFKTSVYIGEIESLCAFTWIVSTSS